MKKTLFALLLLLAALAHPGKTFASHAAGGEITYEWIADSTYRFYFTLYRDCFGIPEPDSAIICFYDSCDNNLNFFKWAQKAPGPNGTTFCPGYNTLCDTPAGTMTGFRKWIYTATVTMPAQCSSWRISANIDLRNFSVNVGAGQSFYLETVMNNTGQYQGSSSPYFTAWPLPMQTINQPAVFNNGGVDPDGDMLAYEVIMPQLCSPGDCSGTPGDVTFLSPVSWPYALPNNPIQTNNTFNLNMLTGTMSFTPAEIGLGVIALRVKKIQEWRTGGLCRPRNGGAGGFDEHSQTGSEHCGCPRYNHNAGYNGNIYRCARQLQYPRLPMAAQWCKCAGRYAGNIQQRNPCG